MKKIKNESIGAKLDPTFPGNVAEEVNYNLRNPLEFLSTSFNGNGKIK